MSEVALGEDQGERSTQDRQMTMMDESSCLQGTVEQGSRMGWKADLSGIRIEGECSITILTSRILT
jgi:hypothetical protein